MERLKWCLPKVDITSGCLTIMVYFCNNIWVFIPTKVQLYCVFVFGNYEVSNAFLLSHRAYILIYGIKWKKKIFFFGRQNSYGGVYEIFLAGNFFEKFLKFFFHILLQISKCTLWVIRAQSFNTFLIFYRKIQRAKLKFPLLWTRKFSKK